MLSIDSFFKVYPLLRELTDLGEYLIEVIPLGSTDHAEVASFVETLGRETVWSGPGELEQSGLLEVMKRLRTAIHSPLVQVIPNAFVPLLMKAITNLPYCKTPEDLEDTFDILDDGHVWLWQFLNETEEQLFGYWGKLFFRRCVELQFGDRQIFAPEEHRLTEKTMRIVMPYATGEPYDSSPNDSLPTNEERIGRFERLVIELRDCLDGISSQVLTTDKQDAGNGWTWRAVRDELDALQMNGERYTSQRELAERIGCSVATVNRAIREGTIELQDWATKQHAVSRLIASPEVSAIVLENSPQEREPGPADILEGQDIDAVLAYVIDQATPEERAAINNMDIAAKRRLAEVVYRDPDKEEQVERYRKTRLKRAD